MSEAKAAGKVGRPSRTVDEEIAAAEERLRALRERKREDERKERERNQKAIAAILKAEGLDEIDAEVWKRAVPAVRKALESVKPIKGEPAPQAVSSAQPMLTEGEILQSRISTQDAQG